MADTAAPHLFDADETTLTFAWAPHPKAQRYGVQLRAVGAPEWTTDATVTSAVLKKKNLEAGTEYECRCRPRDAVDFLPGSEWSPVSAPAATLPAGSTRPAAPTKAAGEATALTVAWAAPEDAGPFELQMLEWSEAGGFGAWRSLSASLSSASCRKKNLAPGATYLFRVRSAAPGAAFSPPSAPLKTSLPLAPGFRQMLGAELRRPDGSAVPVDEALAGKVVAVYFSAHWCGPCRQFTPQLAQAATALRGRGFEVVFVSCDRSEREFGEYHRSMGGMLAIPFDEEDIRSNIQGHFKVQGIPHCIVFDSASGKVLHSNAVQLGGAQGIMQAFEGWKGGAGGGTTAASGGAGGCGSSCGPQGCH